LETSELKKLLNEIGNSVHSMNTIAVALSIMPNNSVETPTGLDISWKPKDLDRSKIIARNYAERSTYVYVAESLFEYLTEISKNAFWAYPSISFTGNEKKAIKVYNFLTNIPNITEEMASLCELLCHWRNRIIHASSSNATLSSKKSQQLISARTTIYENFHHFDTSIALNNFNTKLVTLKDVSTLTTIVIKCCKSVDEHYFNGISKINDFVSYKSSILLNSDFHVIYKQSPSEKKRRQVARWLKLNYQYLDDEHMNKLIELFED
jgi:hypothetical protein